MGAKSVCSHSSGIFKDKVKMFVNQPTPQGTKGKMEHDNLKVTCYCCCPRGNIDMTAWAEKNAYQCGEEAHMVAEVDNQTGSDIKGIKAVFGRTITLIAGKKWNKKGVFTERNKGESGITEKIPGKTAKKGQEAVRISVNTG